MPIRILDAATVGRIAAGEVVERPSSVVKELMENSIDAGATAITVEIRGGGIDYLRVTDNGCGIEPGQVRLAFENHATSKLQTADQLDDIRTLGFRGEALPSIASVSHVEMTTRAKGQETGVRLNIDGGADLRVQEIGCPEGTTFLVKDLFYNIPVRRAFLKKPGYEGGLVADTVARMLMGNPKVSVRFVNNGQTVYHSFGDGNLQHAVFAVYGKAAASQMVPVDAAEGGTRIYGLIGVGELAKSTRAHQAFFINGRAVRCASLTRALEEVCRTRVTIGLYPMCALNVVIPPASVNVNVHPNKLEVRFKDEPAIRQTAQRLMETAFAGERVLELEPEKLAPKTIERVAEVRQVVRPEAQKLESTGDYMAAVNREMEKLKGTSNAALRESLPWTPRPATPPPRPTPVPPQRPAPVLARPVRQEKAEQAAPEGAVPETPVPARPIRREKAEPAAPEGAVPEAPVAARPVRWEKAEQVTLAEAVPGASQAKHVDYRIIGVLMNTYILVEAGDALVMIDQHAAHERLNYEKFMAQVAAGEASQQLLTPMVLHLTAREMALVTGNLDVFREAGYDVEPFGERDIQVRSVPMILGRADMKPAFMDALGALDKVKTAALDMRRAEIMQMSCKSAVKGGDPLSESEVETLIQQMLETGAPPTCPHGRPVMKSISRREMEKMFKRIQ